MSVEETFNAMQMAMIRANITESEEATMARFARIIHPSLSSKFALYMHDTMDELLHISITLENVNKATKVTGPSSSNQQWRRD